MQKKVRDGAKFVLSDLGSQFPNTIYGSEHNIQNLTGNLEKHKMNSHIHEWLPTNTDVVQGLTRDLTSVLFLSRPAFSNK